MSTDVLPIVYAAGGGSGIVPCGDAFRKINGEVASVARELLALRTESDCCGHSCHSIPDADFLRMTGGARGFPIMECVTTRRKVRAMIGMGCCSKRCPNRAGFVLSAGDGSTPGTLDMLCIWQLNELRHFDPIWAAVYIWTYRYGCKEKKAREEEVAFWFYVEWLTRAKINSATMGRGDDCMCVGKK